MDEAIVQYIRKQYNLLMGERRAEEIKIKLGSAYPTGGERLTMKVKGRDLIEGIPKTITVTDEEVGEALREPVMAIVDAVRTVSLERTPPELAADIVDKGIVLAVEVHRHAEPLRRPQEDGARVLSVLSGRTPRLLLRSGIFQGGEDPANTRSSMTRAASPEKDQHARWQAPPAVLAGAFLFNLGQGVLRPTLPLYLRTVFSANYRMVMLIPMVFGAGKWVLGRAVHLPPARWCVLRQDEARALLRERRGGAAGWVPEVEALGELWQQSAAPRPKRPPAGGIDADISRWAGWSSPGHSPAPPARR